MFYGKRIFITLCCAIAAVFLIQTAATAEEKPAAEAPTGDVSVSVLNQYIWRGYELSRNSIVIQPSATVGWKGFSINLWGNIDTSPYYGGSDGKRYHGTWNETDLTLSYTKTLGLVNLGVGYIYYSLAALNSDGLDRADAQEVFASIGLNTLLSPTLTVYREIDHYRNWYFLLGISHVFELNKMVSLKLAASASYLLSTYADAALFNAGAGYGGYPKFDGDSLATDDKFSNFHDGVVTASLPVKATDKITVTPTLSYVFPLSNEARLEMKGQGLKGTATPSERDSSYLYGGVTLSFSF
ncbi:MAG: hypothetical protein AB2L22_02285 [Syntrophales bacterium]